MRSAALCLAALVFVPVPALFAGDPAALVNPTGAPAAGQAMANDPKVDAVLDTLDQRGQDLHDFTARVSITEGDPNLGTVSTRTGQVWFQLKPNNDGRIRVTFDKLKQGQLTRDEKQDYLLDDGLLVDRNYHKTAEARRQVVKPGQKMNLLKLGEGPFPLPIGQKKEEVYRLFDVTIVPPNPKDDKSLADTVHLHLKPKPGTQFARHFGLIDVWVSSTTHFPVQIKTDNPDESDPRTTRLEDVKVNTPGSVADKDFVLPPIDPTWSIHTEKYTE